jgi:hypothetical protein
MHTGLVEQLHARRVCSRWRGPLTLFAAVTAIDDSAGGERIGGGSGDVRRSLAGKRRGELQAWGLNCTADVAVAGVLPGSTGQSTGGGGGGSGSGEGPSAGPAPTPPGGGCRVNAGAPGFVVACSQGTGPRGRAWSRNARWACVSRPASPNRAQWMRSRGREAEVRRPGRLLPRVVAQPVAVFDPSTSPGFTGGSSGGQTLDRRAEISLKYYLARCMEILCD